jgi:hypothetical protein
MIEDVAEITDWIVLPKWYLKKETVSTKKINKKK